MGTHVCVPLTKQHGGQEDTSLALGSERDPVNYRMHSTQNPPLTTLCAYALPPTTVLTHALLKEDPEFRVIWDYIAGSCLRRKERRKVRVYIDTQCML